MSVTAEQLSKSGARGKELDNIVRELLQLIDSTLQRADRMWGRNVVPIDIPMSWSGIVGLPKKDQHSIVYSAIIKSLETRGFEVRILLETDKTTLYVAWMTDLDKTEVTAMSALISSKRIPREQVDQFIAQGALKAPNAASEVEKGRAKPAPPLVVAETDKIMQPRGGVGLAPSTVTKPASTTPASKAEIAILQGL
jgi:hypothetical protein